MRTFIFYSILIAFFNVSFMSADPVIFKMDNGQSGGSYMDSKTISWEETCLLKPKGPCKVNKIRVYLAGTVAAKDTIWIVGDPAEGSYPPSLFVHYINALTDPIILDYPGQAGWFEIDISQANIVADGISAIVIQHLIKAGGPYFVIDNNGQGSSYNSFINNVFTPNPDFYNIAGTMAQVVQGNYLVRMEVEYLFPQGDVSAPPPMPKFVDVTEEAGLVDADSKVVRAAMASAIDWNNDGFDDVAIGSKFFQNNRDGTFSDKTKDFDIKATGTIWADADNDGFLDCFAAMGNGNDRLYWGNQDGGFDEDTDETIVLDQPTISPMWLDYNNDGLLDLFIAYGRRTVGGNEVYYPDQLFKNLGDRKFENVTQSAGIAAGEPAPYYDCWGGSICDYNNDGWADIFVATYRLAPDLLYKNNQDGTFSEVGALTEARGIPTYYDNYFGHGMGSDWGDYDNDGDVDLAVGNLAHWDSRGLASNPSVILENTGGDNTLFVNKTFEMGLKFFEMNSGILWGDWDNDGFLDLFHAQYSYDAKGSGVDRYSRIFFNSGPDNNYKFEDRTWELGCMIHGAWTPIRLDYDNDGDLDLIVASSQENLKLFRNDMDNKGNWIAVRLKGSPENNISSEAFGSSVTVYTGENMHYRA
ncbi:MAG: VCBS repeat-containing protein, partial [Chlorobi bacterium]|nr:VCBS repeat-containing protein [Chlorobiota bacterium]